MISPHLGLGEFSDYTHLSQVSSLCGACTENIPLHDLLLHNRQLEQQENLRPTSEKLLWKDWQKGMTSRTLMNSPSLGKNTFSTLFLKRAWGERHQFPKFPKKTFNQLWKEGKV